MPKTIQEYKDSDYVCDYCRKRHFGGCRSYTVPFGKDGAWVCESTFGFVRMTDKDWQRLEEETQ